MCLIGDSNVGVRGRGGCTGMVAPANGVDVVGCASVEGSGVRSEVTRRFTDLLSINGTIVTRGSNLMTKCVTRDVSGCVFLDTKFSQFLFDAVMFV